MSRKKLLVRMQDCHEKEGISIAHMARQARVPQTYLYQMRSQGGNRTGLSMEDAINLHEYLKSKGY